MKTLKNLNIEWLNSKKKIFIDTLEKSIDDNEEIIELNLSQSMKAEGIIENEQNEFIVPKIIFEDEKFLYFQLQLRENTEYICEITLPGTKQEVENQMILSRNKSWPFTNISLDSVFAREDKRYWIEEKDSNNMMITKVVGRLNFKNHVGLADLSLGEKEKLFIEVITYKLNYYEDFKNLLDSIADQIVDLVLQVGEATGVSFETDFERKSEDYIKIIYLRQMFEDERLKHSLEAIRRNPHAKLNTEHYKVKLANLKNPDIYLIASKGAFLEYRLEGPLANKFLGYTPNKLFETDKNETYDTPENRYIKNFLEDILWDCQRIVNSIEKRFDNGRKISIKWQAILNEVNGWINIIYEWLSQSFWKDIGMMQYIPSNSQVLQKREGYRNVLKLDLKYQLAIKLQWNIELLFNKDYGYIKPIYELYEIWCFFKLREVLVSLFGIEKETNLWCIDKRQLGINLKKGISSKLEFDGEYNNRKIIIKLYYNRLFKGKENSKVCSYSIDFKPDYSLNIQIPDKDVNVFIHFDAKYSFHVNMCNDKEDNLYTAKRIHLEKMHAYKDAIRNSIGAYILYPGNLMRIFSECENSLFGVGAFPLKPNTDIDEKNNVENFIKLILDTLSS
ncbi:DUF2357 domain-containing protein [Clostridium botulinum]|nr:DUF2357 domain-containing protein [Clostridium botulinum]NFP54147.1 DUF2357 domain-containing protein [Clostridium botulinum]NFT11362.1 DUF2357 domain-containing protein [Clostridium botulinum]NFT62521.1 DUF2357 domain-containing protein [Clostridium botulinum]